MCCAMFQNLSHTDYKLHAKNFRQGVLQVKGVENDDD